ncbi:unannotated protein [freshwater metagenome]|uniref:Unannotated protein n=1 Tax=freshwater metagenome TaxID=449393 RepID=A0A6J7GQ16_9ZZZZ
MQQVGLAQPGVAVDEQRVVGPGRRLGDRDGRGVGEPVAVADDEAVEDVLGVEPEVAAAGAAVVAELGRRTVAGPPAAGTLVGRPGVVGVPGSGPAGVGARGVPGGTVAAGPVAAVAGLGQPDVAARGVGAHPEGAAAVVELGPGGAVLGVPVALGALAGVGVALVAVGPLLAVPAGTAGLVEDRCRVDRRCRRCVLELDGDLGVPAELGGQRLGEGGTDPGLEHRLGELVGGGEHEDALDQAQRPGQVEHRVLLAGQVAGQALPDPVPDRPQFAGGVGHRLLSPSVPVVPAARPRAARRPRSGPPLWTGQAARSTPLSTECGRRVGTCCGRWWPGRRPANDPPSSASCGWVWNEPGAGCGPRLCRPPPETVPTGAERGDANSTVHRRATTSVWLGGAGPGPRRQPGRGPSTPPRRPSAAGHADSAMLWDVCGQRTVAACPARGRPDVAAAPPASVRAGVATARRA